MYDKVSYREKNIKIIKRKIHLHYILKKNPHISVPVQLKPMLFKDQIYCLMEKFLKYFKVNYKS